jgi:hypothetical protein
VSQQKKPAAERIPRRAFVIPIDQGSSKYLTHTGTIAQVVAQFLQDSFKNYSDPRKAFRGLCFKKSQSPGVASPGSLDKLNTVHMYPDTFMPISRQRITGTSLTEIPSDFRWYHIVLTTYGNWLPGDQRGFRTRHHRQHVEGDYKNPPQEDYSGLHSQSSAQMTCPSAHLSKDYREIVGIALIERLQLLGGFVLTAAVSNTHIHMLVKVPKHETRRWTGLAKKHAWFEMRGLGWKDKLWAKRGKIQPIHSRKHQENCFAYILRHIHEGAWVWVNDCVTDSVIERIIRNK